jgi:carbonic anhydrase/acetyltransferase-like protein (isoleucine patch superfamily)
MTLWALGDTAPRIDPSAYIHPDAVVIGAVTIGAQANIWPTAVLRGDCGNIHIGARTSIQDGTVVHTTEHWPTIIGADCVVGHNTHLEGCTVEDRCLIGSGAIVLNRAVVRTGAIVGAQALITEDMEIPSGHMALGVPAQLRTAPPQAANWITEAVDFYLANAKRYAAQLRRLD